MSEKKKRKSCSAVNKKRGPKRSARMDAGLAAGLSRGQIYRALKIASIPKEEFEQLVESDNPPTVSKLVAIGRGKRYVQQGRRLLRCPHCGKEFVDENKQEKK